MTVLDGCTSCGSTDTATIDGVTGRRCVNCPPTLDLQELRTKAAHGFPGAAGAYVRSTTLPPGRFQSELATDMAGVGRGDAAFAYLGAWVRAECDRRFDAAVLRLSGLSVGRLTAGVISADIVLTGPITRDLPF